MAGHGHLQKLLRYWRKVLPVWHTGTWHHFCISLQRAWILSINIWSLKKFEKLLKGTNYSVLHSLGVWWLHLTDSGFWWVLGGAIFQLFFPIRCLYESYFLCLDRGSGDNLLQDPKRRYAAFICRYRLYLLFSVLMIFFFTCIWFFDSETWWFSIKKFRHLTCSWFQLFEPQLKMPKLYFTVR